MSPLELRIPNIALAHQAYNKIECTLSLYFVVHLKEYSLILITSFYDINQKILRKNYYFQNFS